MTKVRVRIAPSPTGPLHLGTARTALFNFLFAQKHGGVFVVRIEDTDLERSDSAFERDIVESLRWLGLAWDEGVEVGGAFGPYRQSERTDRYAPRIAELLDCGSAYYCFCSEKQLESERKEQRARGEAPRYRGTCRSITRAEAEKRRKNGEAAVIRFAMPEKTIAFTDLIRGEISFDGRAFGDIIIAKNLETPLYNFAAVVDDADMEITHVLRGEDHIANTPKQIAIAEALGMTPPSLGHFPLILGPDRTKLSKRHGATSVRELRDTGYFPEAVVNFLALLGWNPGTDQEVFSLDDLIASFDLSRIQKSGAVWNQEKLEWFNRRFLAQPKVRWLTRKTIPESLYSRMRNVAERNQWTAQEETLARVAPLVLERIPLRNLEEAMEGEYRYFFEAPAVSKELLRWKDMTDENVRESLKTSADVLGRILDAEWKRERLESDLLSAATAFTAPPASTADTAASTARPDRGRLLWPLRVALSGRKQSPSPFDIAAVLGKTETLQRLSAVLATL